MTAGQLLMTYTVGAGALAFWSYVRWPGAAPATMMGAVLRILGALVLLQVGLVGLELGLEAARGVAVFVFAAAVIPVLTYAFLASLWFMKVCADRMRGAF